MNEKSHEGKQTIPLLKYYIHVMYIFIHTLLSLIQFSKCLLETPGVQILLRAKKTFSL